MKTSAEIISEIEDKITSLKLIGRHLYFGMFENTPRNVYDEVKKNFVNKYYATEIKICPKGVMDVIIHF